MDVYLYEDGDGQWCTFAGSVERLPSKADAFARGREILSANPPGRLIRERPVEVDIRQGPAPAEPVRRQADRVVSNRSWAQLVGPSELGRSVIVASGAEVPAPWAGCDRLRVWGASDGPLSGRELLHAVRAAFISRSPVIYEVDGDPPTPGRHTIDNVWDVPIDFEFEDEAAWELIVANSVDGADPDRPVCPWLERAVGAGAQQGGDADVVLADGSEAWLDGGPFRLWRDGELSAPAAPAIRLTGGAVNIDASDPAELELAPDQLEAVREAGGVSRITAPAGSGKTRVLTERVRYLLAGCRLPAGAVTLVAFNKRAQNEMRERTSDLPDLQVQTLNALALAIINGNHGFGQRGRRVATIDELQVRSLISDMVKFPRRANTDPAAAWIDALSAVRLGLRDPDEVEADFGGDVDGFAEFFPRYRGHLTERGVVDFDEQIYGAIRILLSEPETRRRAQSRCQMLLVDEFQDLTPAHLLLIGLLAGARRNVFGVGDDDQTIYGYSGASPDWLVNFDDYFPGATHHALQVNYRCPAPVISASLNLLSHNRERVVKEIHPGPLNSRAEDSLRISPADEPTTATTDRVADLVESGVSATDIAVLSRVNTLLIPVQIALQGRQIPVTTREGLHFLDRTGVRAALAWVDLATTTGALNPRDMQHAARRPGRGLSPKLLEWMSEHSEIGSLRRLADRLSRGKDSAKLNGYLDDIENLRERAGSAVTAELLEIVRAEIGLDRALETLDEAHRGRNAVAHSDDLRALIALGRMHPGPSDFSAWLKDVLATRSEEPGVELSTVHRVKGLEWLHVIVHDASGAIVPHHLSADMEEERRVFHVAITRGRASTTIITDGADPSPFIPELSTTAPPHAERPADPEPGRSRRLSEGRSEKVSAGAKETAASPEVFEALRAWRLDRSKDDGVPAYVVASDKTLTEIAARLPANEPELLDVSGIGPAKLETYGDEILSILDQFL